MANVSEIVEVVEAAVKAQGGFIRRESSLLGGWMPDAEATTISAFFDDYRKDNIIAAKYAASDAIRAQIDNEIWAVKHENLDGYKIWHLRYSSTGKATGEFRTGFKIVLRQQGKAAA
jgi:hypothetical protein